MRTKDLISNYIQANKCSRATAFRHLAKFNKELNKPRTEEYILIKKEELTNLLKATYEIKELRKEIDQLYLKTLLNSTDLPRV